MHLQEQGEMNVCACLQAVVFSWISLLWHCSGPPAQGMVPLTVGWVLLHQVSQGRQAHRPRPCRQSFIEILPRLLLTASSWQLKLTIAMMLYINNLCMLHTLRNDRYKYDLSCIYILHGLMYVMCSKQGRGLEVVADGDSVSFRMMTVLRNAIAAIGTQLWKY